MEPIVPLDQMEQIAQGIDHAEGICVAPDGWRGWHVTRFHVPGMVGVPLFQPTRDQLGGSQPYG